MYELKEIKKMRTYFNTFITDREKYDICFSKLENGDLSSVITMDSFSVRYMVKSLDGNTENSFENILVKFSDFYDTIGEIKGIKELDICLNETFFINEKIKHEIPFHIIKTRSFNGEHIATINMESFTNAINLCSASAKSGITEFDSNVVCTMETDVMYLSSYTTGLFVGNKLSIKNGKPYKFLIKNNQLVLLKKWLKYANDPKKIMEDDVCIYVYEMFLLLRIENIAIIFPIEENVKGLCEKYQSITTFLYPEKEQIKFRNILDVISVANKEKRDKANFASIFGHETMLYRPLCSDIVYQLSDLDGYMKCSIVNSKNDVLKVNTELPYLDSLVLFFCKKTVLT